MSGPNTDADAGAPQTDPTQADDGTPQEQPEQPVGATSPAKASLPVDVPALQRGYTQATQAFAEVKRELGLPKEASLAEVKAAIAATRYAEQGGEDYASLDPAVQQKLVTLEETVWAQNQMIYGDAAVKARELQQAAVNASPQEFMAMFHQAVLDVTEAPEDAGTPDEEQAAPDEQPVVPELGAGDTPLPTNRPAADAGKRGSGDMVGFVHQMRERLGIPTG